MNDLLPDPALSLMVRNAETDPTTVISLTISVNGAIFTGDLVGSVRWFEELGRMIDDNGAARTYFDGMAQGIAQFNDQMRADGRDVDINFMHLINARTVDGAGDTPPEGTSCWRIRLADVAAWTVGFYRRA